MSVDLAMANMLTCNSSVFATLILLFFLCEAEVGERTLIIKLQYP